MGDGFKDCLQQLKRGRKGHCKTFVCDETSHYTRTAVPKGPADLWFKFLFSIFAKKLFSISFFLQN